MINKVGPVKMELMSQSLLSVDVVCGEERRWVSGTTLITPLRGGLHHPTLYI